MQLTVQQPDLAQMFGQDSLFNTLYGMQRMDQANANNTQNLGQAQQDQTFQADMHPLDMGLAQANIGHTNALTDLTNAQVPGMQADSRTKVRNDADAESVDPVMRRQALISKIAASTTEDDLKKHMAQATLDLTATNPDGTPDMKRRADAQMVISTAPEIQNELRKVKAQGDNAARVAGIEAGSRERIEKMQEDAGKYNKFRLDFMMASAKAKANFQQQASIAQQQADEMLSAADNASDPAEKKYYQDKAAQYLQQKQEAVANDYAARSAPANTANAAKPNTSALLGVNPVANPAAVPQPPQQPVPQAPVVAPPAPPGGLVTVFKPDGTAVKIRAEGLAHLPPGWKKGS